MQARSPRSLLSPRVFSEDTTTHEYTTFSVKFTHDIPVEQGAFAMVQFPSGFLNEIEDQFNFDSQLVSMSTIGGMFGTRSLNVKFSTDFTNMRVETIVGTSKYSSSGSPTI